jgi:hypothetical protein
VWDELVAWCQVHKKHEQPSSPLGVALRYFTNHQVALARFLEYGYVPPDNGIVERLHVRTATWGSLCVTPSSTWKPQRSLVRRIATRATAAPRACAQSLLDVWPTQIVGHDLPGRVLDDLARRQDATLDHAADRVVRDTDLRGGLGHREAAAVLDLRLVAGDVMIPSVRGDALGVPCQALANPNAFSSARNSKSAEIATRAGPIDIAAHAPASSIQAGRTVRDRSGVSKTTTSSQLRCSRYAIRISLSKSGCHG